MDGIKFLPALINIIKNIGIASTEIERVHQIYNFNPKKKIISYSMFIVFLGVIGVPSYFLIKHLHPYSWVAAMLLLLFLGGVGVVLDKIKKGKLTNGRRDYLLPLFTGMLGLVCICAIGDVTYLTIYE